MNKEIIEPKWSDKLHAWCWVMGNRIYRIDNQCVLHFDSCPRGFTQAKTLFESIFKQ